MIHQHKPVSALASLDDWMTWPFITVSETVREAKRVENSVKLRSWVEKLERQAQKTRVRVTERREILAERIPVVGISKRSIRSKSGSKHVEVLWGERLSQTAKAVRRSVWTIRTESVCVRVGGMLWMKQHYTDTQLINFLSWLRKGN